MNFLHMVPGHKKQNTSIQPNNKYNNPDTPFPLFSQTNKEERDSKR